ncbi:MAG: glycosyltransferase [Eubacteriales bacterium]|nr:glycosyltransferase [Eubacteriales bacterium]
MKKEKKLTVIIPIYNMQKYLKECLDSALGQTLEDIELICVDDGSTDQSLNILKDYSKKDDRITIIHQENKGVSAARNIAIEKAKSKYVCFMDPDDLYPDKTVLEDLYIAAEIHNAQICGGSFSHYDQETGKLTTVFAGAYLPYTFKEDGYVDYKDYQFDYGYHRFIYDLDLLKENKIVFPPYKRFQDPPFFVKAMLAAGRFYALKRVSYQYRLGHQSPIWSTDKLIDFSKGICDNLKISAENGLNELHAYTVQRIVEHKEVFLENAGKLFDIRIQRSLYTFLLLTRPDMLQESEYKVEAEALFDVFRELIMDDTTWKKRYIELKETETFKVGKAVLWLPRKLMMAVKKQR